MFSVRVRKVPGTGMENHFVSCLLPWIEVDNVVENSQFGHTKRTIPAYLRNQVNYSERCFQSCAISAALMGRQIRL